MNTILETNAAVEGVRRGAQAPSTDGPLPEWVRGECPLCGAEVVWNSYYVGGKGYVALQECWMSLGEKPSCDYRKAL